jgi:hypothetical protein
MREWQVSEFHFHQRIRAHPYPAYLSRICPATPQAFEDRDALSGEKVLAQFSATDV